MKSRVYCIALLVVFLFPAVAYTQPYKVAGVAFGTTYEDAKEAFDKMYGVNTANGNQELEYVDVIFAGLHFTFANFTFTRIGNTQYLSSASYNEPFKITQLKEAKDFRDAIAKIIGEKYIKAEAIDKSTGLKLYAFGLDPNNPNRNIICVYIIKGENKKGEMSYYVYVEWTNMLMAKSDDF